MTDFTMQQCKLYPLSHETLNNYYMYLQNESVQASQIHTQKASVLQLEAIR